MKKTPKTLLLLVVLALAGATVWAVVARNRAGQRPQYRLAAVDRGNIVRTVSASGTLNAVVTVRVGSQVSGQIKELLANYNSPVIAGQVIARIDPENLEARVRQAEAELQVAKANVAIQKAAVLRCKAELENARAALSASEARTLKAEVALKDAGRDLNRKRALRDRTVISENEIDKARAAYDQAMAQLRSLQAEQKARLSMVSTREAALKMAEEQVVHARAQVKQREASVHQCRTDLAHTVIRSPVTGVVIERNVDMGQTVAASLQAPTLFTIAKDLRDMQVEADIDEADIGLIKEGQKASFTVDAFPREEFTGFVTQIRKAPKTVQNVVTYTVVISAANPDLRLLPGMTANVNIVVDERRDVLRVPNAALRFVPPNLKKRDRGHRTGRPSRTGLSPSSGALKERIQKLITVLKMNEQQQARVWEILADARRRIVAARMAGTSGRELDSLMAEVRAGSREAVKAILSPEQRKAYAKILEQLEGRRRAVPQRIWVAGPNGLPVARDILAGITDGTYTEVVRGDLSQGERVIVGIQQPGAGHGAL